MRLAGLDDTQGSIKGIANYARHDFLVMRVRNAKGAKLPNPVLLTDGALHPYSESENLAFPGRREETEEGVQETLVASPLRLVRS